VKSSKTPPGAASFGWMVRAGKRRSAYADVFLSDSVVALSDSEGVGPIPESKTALVRKIEERLPHEKAATRQAWASQLFPFAHEVAEGDGLVTYDAQKRLYLLGTVTGGYFHQPGETLAHARKASWTKMVERDRLSAAARNTLGAIQTIFKVSGTVWQELERLSTPIGATVEEHQPIAVGPVVDEDARLEILEKADSFIEDAISRLEWSQLQDLVAGVLEAMGYRARVAPAGSDRGCDITASPDGLMLQEPRIFVEVKHRRGAMGSPEIRSFLGGRSQGDRCLYVSTGGFTKEARYEADRSTIPLTLIELPRLRELLVEYYERLDPEVRSLVPLRRLYWPV
jgi:restriction system protein